MRQCLEQNMFLARNERSIDIYGMDGYISVQPYAMRNLNSELMSAFPCIRKIGHKLKLVKKNDKKQFMIKCEKLNRKFKERYRKRTYSVLFS